MCEGWAFFDHRLSKLSPGVFGEPFCTIINQAWMTSVPRDEVSQVCALTDRHTDLNGSMMKMKSVRMSLAELDSLTQTTWHKVIKHIFRATRQEKTHTSRPQLVSWVPQWMWAFFYPSTKPYVDRRRNEGTASSRGFHVNKLEQSDRLRPVAARLKPTYYLHGGTN